MEYLCNDCPRRCGAARTRTQAGGVCLSPALPRVVRAAPHFGEEPCISGTRGSGAVFFSGCNLRCVFCQNREISRASVGRTLTVPQLRDTLLRLRDTGVHNINLVTGSHFVRPIAQALEGLALGIPVVWNSSGYESAETLRMLEGLVQVYLPDFKYWKAEPAGRYSAAADYPETAKAAVREMFRQRGAYALDENGLLRSGVLVRHLILPGQELAAMDVMDFIAEKRAAGGRMRVTFSCEAFVGPYEERVRSYRFFCHAGVNIASILIDGRICACPNIDRDRFSQGNIYKDNFYEVWENRFEPFRHREWAKTGRCAHCKQWKNCLGNGMHNWHGPSKEVLQCHYAKTVGR